MRVNVYSEELTNRVEHTSKQPANAKDVTFFGIQFFVGPKNEHTPGDDDSSAVIFWFNGEYERGLLRESFKKALALLDDPAIQF